MVRLPAFVPDLGRRDTDSDGDVYARLVRISSRCGKTPPRHSHSAAGQGGVRETALASQSRSSGLLDNGVHQSRDRAVQRFVGAPHRFDLVDGVQHRSVMPASELPPDFLKRRAGELPRNVHGDLPRLSKQRSKKQPGRPLLGVNAEVCSKKDLTEPTLLEISG